MLHFQLREDYATYEYPAWFLALSNEFELDFNYVKDHWGNVWEKYIDPQWRLKLICASFKPWHHIFSYEKIMLHVNILHGSSLFVMSMKLISIMWKWNEMCGQKWISHISVEIYISRESLEIYLKIDLDDFLPPPCGGCGERLLSERDSDFS